MISHLILGLMCSVYSVSCFRLLGYVSWTQRQKQCRKPQSLVLQSPYSTGSSFISVLVMPVNEINRPINLNLEEAEQHVLWMENTLRVHRSFFNSNWRIRKIVLLTSLCPFIYKVLLSHRCLIWQYSNLCLIFWFSCTSILFDKVNLPIRNNNIKFKSEEI